MRPVNLIPPDQRRDRISVRSGPLSYLLVGVLALGLGVVTMFVLTDNKIADRKAEIADLNQRNAAIQSRIDALQPFIEFKQSEQQRVTAIRDLANSRFDWDRVMRELSIVFPPRVSLTNLTATAGGAADPSGTVTGTPGLELTGCATGQERVATLLAALNDIDGVTSVDLQKSERGEASSGSSSTTSTSSSDCGPHFEYTISAAFGDADTGQGAPQSAPVAPAGTTPTSESAPVSDTSTAATP